MKKFDLNSGWALQEGLPSSIPMMPVQTKPVNLPHDFVVEMDVRKDGKNGTNTGFYPGGTRTYTKKMTIPAQWEAKRVLFACDGCYGHSKIIVNGNMMGVHHYGYTPFQVDISDHLYYGDENRIAVIVSNDNEPNSRWYSGGGLYRGAQLLVSEQLHIANDGIYAYTNHFVEEDAFITVETTVENHTASDTCAWIDLKITPEGTEELCASGKIKLFVPRGKSAVARTQLCVENARRWDIESPNLYHIHAQLVTESKTLDAADTVFGIRTISVDAKYGFCLNGRPLKLKGGCLHHDNGILGAASFYDSEYRRVKLHKENGYNALRMAHNPASTALLECCDRLGILVIEEAFDAWHMHKNYHDFSMQFDMQWEQELTAFITRDRNHPSIIFWSIGNELPEQGGLARGYETSAMLTEAVRRLDATRPVCGSLCSFFSGLDDKDNSEFWKSFMSSAAQSGGQLNNLDSDYGKEIWASKTEAFSAPWDMVGYNYLDYQYKKTGSLFPNRVICCTESKPSQMEEYWQAVQQYPYLIGDFVWTSMDYIGEAGIGKVLYSDAENVRQDSRKLNYTSYPWRTAGCGDFDLCGFERPQLAYRRILWGSKETKIFCTDPANNHKIELLGRYAWPERFNSWNWPCEEGTAVAVTVYSAGEEVALYLNGTCLGRKPVQHSKAAFCVPYAHGEITAISYSDGEEISRDALYSGGDAAAIRITTCPYALHGTRLPADGQSLCFAVVELIDKNGNPVHYAQGELFAEVEGCATLQAFGSSRPVTEENYTTGHASTYHGKLLAIIRSGTETGTATLKVHAPGYPDAYLEILMER